MQTAPIHRRIADDLRRQIREEHLVPGYQLPAEQELARLYGASRGTVRQALTTLRAEGAIASRRGARWVVLATPLAQTFDELLSFSAWAHAEGFQPGGRVIELARRRAGSDDARQLGLAEGDPVVHLLRVRLLSGTPVMIERTTFVEPVGRLLFTFDLETSSIYEQLGDLGIVFARARHTIESVAASVEDARLLGVPRRTPLLRQGRATTSQSGRPLEWSDDRYRGDAVSFVIDNTAMSGNLERLVASPAAPNEGADELD